MFGDWDSRGGEVGLREEAPRRGGSAGLSTWRLWSRLYGDLARRRRRWYEAHPEARRRLDRPVISVGNLTVGGSGKTPTVACICRRLLAMGERPSVLSRGYGRRHAPDGVVTVRDPDYIRADLDQAGDEPLMLARALDKVTILVSPNRYLAGRLAERRFGCTVHVLDDGFQHFALERDVDLLVGYPADLEGASPLPTGRLREPLDVAAAADALVAIDASREDAERLAQSLGVRRALSAIRMLEDARLLEPLGRQVPVSPSRRVLAVAGVARPGRFFADLQTMGWTLSGQLAFPDHHRYSGADVARIVESARQVRAELILTTEKDSIRLRHFRPFPFAVAWVPLEVAIQPDAEFGEWLGQRLATARERDELLRPSIRSEPQAVVA